MQHAQAHDLIGTAIPRSTFYDSPFGRMFGRLEPWTPPGGTDADREAALMAFAIEHMVEAADARASDNKDIPAGYTYFGQFVDHDITFDTTTSIARQNDPNKHRNFRTPRLDLDSVYGGGPAQTPAMYQRDDPGMFLIGVGESQVEADLPRNHEGTAIIGDPRNDENVLVAQLHLAFLLLHNRTLGEVRVDFPGDTPDQQFRRAQRIVRWFYQYVVWNDFVHRLVHDGLHADALATVVDSVSASKSTTRRVSRRGFYRWRVAPYIPVEFSAAAFRFGHAMVRPGYLLNANVGDDTELPIFAEPSEASITDDGELVDIADAADLRGGRTLPRGFQVQWDWFFRFVPERRGEVFPQRSRRLDTRLSPAMSRIPDGAGATVPLAFLNLRRGWRLDLPSGPAVADAMGVPSGDRPEVAAGTPEESLWYYILKETTTLGAMSGKMLGPVGGTIVAEVLAGLVDGDPLSFANLHPLWTPRAEPILVRLLGSASPVVGEGWTVADLLRAAGVDERPPVIDLTEPADREPVP